MKRKKVWDYLMESLTGFCSLALAILFFFALYRIQDIFKIFRGIVVILMPMIYGLVFAFVLSPICDTYRAILDENLPEFKKKPEMRGGVVRGGGVTLAVLTLIVIVYILFVLIVPELFESIMAIVYNMDSISNSVLSWGNSLFESRPELQLQFQEISSQVGTVLAEWIQNTFVPGLQDMISSLSEGIISILGVLKNMVIGLIVSVYLLFNRELYSAQAKRVLYSAVSPVWANRIMRLVRETKDVFSGFVMGKILDSLIIGILCFICMSVLHMPYTVLISTIVGVTNIIPYFGPFIGAIPSTFLILTVNPLQALYFIIFILILQQVDGNIIGPKILGSSTGLASFWVLFALLLFGGMWGVVGLIVGVPLFAILYDILGNALTYRLQQIHMPIDTMDYGLLDHIDAETGEFVMKDGTRKYAGRRKHLVKAVTIESDEEIEESDEDYREDL